MTILRDQLATAATELDRVLAMVSSADGDAQVLHGWSIDLELRDSTAILVDLRRRFDDAERAMASARDTLSDCAEVLQRDVIGTSDADHPDPQPASGPAADPGGTPKRRARAGHTFDWLLVRLLMVIVGFVVTIAEPVLDSWLHLVSINDDLYRATFTVIFMTSVSVGHLDWRRIPPPVEVAIMQFLGVVLAGIFLVGDVLGWRDLTGPLATTAIIVLALNATVGIVVLPRHRGGVQPT